MSPLSRLRVAPVALAAAILTLPACNMNQASAPDPVLQEERLDPWSGPAQRQSIAAASHETLVDAKRDAIASYPLSIFGETPNSRVAAMAPHRNFDPTENLSQVTFATEGGDFDPDVAPSGTQIFFASTRHRPTADIYVQTIGGPAVTQLTSDPAQDVMPAVSPDGSKVAFASNRNGSYDIYVMDAAGGQPVRVTENDAHEIHPTWSPDGSTLAYCRLSQQSDRWEIWATDLDKPSAHTFLTFGLFPEFHPTEDTLLYQRSRERGDRFFSIWTVRVEDGQAVAPTEIAASSISAIINPSWSPDGRFIACSTVFTPEQTDPDGRPEYADVWILDTNGAMKTNVTGGWFLNTMPTWTPDGDVLFVSNRAGVQTVWSLKPFSAITTAGLQPPSNPNSGVATAPTSDDD
jgi:TolB protein